MYFMNIQLLIIESYASLIKTNKVKGNKFNGIIRDIVV